MPEQQTLNTNLSNPNTSTGTTDIDQKNNEFKTPFSDVLNNFYNGVLVSPYGKNPADVPAYSITPFLSYIKNLGRYVTFLFGINVFEYAQTGFPGGSKHYNFMFPKGRLYYLLDPTAATKFGPRFNDSYSINQNLQFFPFVPTQSTILEQNLQQYLKSLNLEEGSDKYNDFYLAVMNVTADRLMNLMDPAKIFSVTKPQDASLALPVNIATGFLNDHRVPSYSITRAFAVNPPYHALSDVFMQRVRVNTNRFVGFPYSPIGQSNILLTSYFPENYTMLGWAFWAYETAIGLSTLVSAYNALSGGLQGAAVKAAVSTATGRTAVEAMLPTLFNRALVTVSRTLGFFGKRSPEVIFKILPSEIIKEISKFAIRRNFPGLYAKINTFSRNFLAKNASFMILRAIDAFIINLFSPYYETSLNNVLAISGANKRAEAFVKSFSGGFIGKKFTPFDHRSLYLPIFVSFYRRMVAESANTSLSDSFKVLFDVHNYTNNLLEDAQVGKVSALGLFPQQSLYIPGDNITKSWEEARLGWYSDNPYAWIPIQRAGLRSENLIETDRLDAIINKQRPYLVAREAFRYYIGKVIFEGKKDETIGKYFPDIDNFIKWIDQDKTSYDHFSRLLSHVSEDKKQQFFENMYRKSLYEILLSDQNADSFFRIYLNYSRHYYSKIYENYNYRRSPEYLVYRVEPGVGYSGAAAYQEDKDDKTRVSYVINEIGKFLEKEMASGKYADFAEKVEPQIRYFDLFEKQKLLSLDSVMRYPIRDFTLATANNTIVSFLYASLAQGGQTSVTDPTAVASRFPVVTVLAPADIQQKYEALRQTMSGHIDRGGVFVVPIQTDAGTYYIWSLKNAPPEYLRLIARENSFDSKFMISQTYKAVASMHNALKAKYNLRNLQDRRDLLQSLMEINSLWGYVDRSSALLQHMTESMLLGSFANDVYISFAPKINFNNTIENTAFEFNAKVQEQINKIFSKISSLYTAGPKERGVVESYITQISTALKYNDSYGPSAFREITNSDMDYAFNYSIINTAMNLSVQSNLILSKLVDHLGDEAKKTFSNKLVQMYTLDTENLKSQINDARFLREYQQAGGLDEKDLIHYYEISRRQFLNSSEVAKNPTPGLFVNFAINVNRLINSITSPVYDETYRDKRDHVLVFSNLTENQKQYVLYSLFSSLSIMSTLSTGTKYKKDIDGALVFLVNKIRNPDKTLTEQDKEFLQRISSVMDEFVADLIIDHSSISAEWNNIRFSTKIQRSHIFPLGIMGGFGEFPGNEERGLITKSVEEAAGTLFDAKGKPLYINLVPTRIVSSK